MKRLIKYSYVKDINEEVLYSFAYIELNGFSYYGIAVTSELDNGNKPKGREYAEDRLLSALKGNPQDWKPYKGEKPICRRVQDAIDLDLLLAGYINSSSLRDKFLELSRGALTDELSHV